MNDNSDNFRSQNWFDVQRSSSSESDSMNVQETLFDVSFCRFLWSDELGDNVAIWRCDFRIIVVDCVCDLKSEFFVELDGIIVVCLHVQVDLTYVLLRALVENMIQQLCTYTKSRNKLDSNIISRC